MATVYEWLEGIALRMRQEAANGAIPTSEKITVRQLLGRFGYLIRGNWINGHIRNELETHKLVTLPDFEYVWIGSTIAITLDSAAVDDSRPDYESGSTLRIGSLPAANNKPESVNPQSPLSEATTLMGIRNYSQLPVMIGQRDVKGMISWKSIGHRLSMGKSCDSVSDCKEEAKVVSANTPLFEAVRVIDEHGYVLVQGTDNIITGIVTASDLAFEFLKLTGPFLLIGEIERHLRHLMHGKFTVGELQNASSDERSIQGIGDLTLGGYVQLLQNMENWAKLSLEINRETFVADLDEVRQIRNDVVHFNPDGLDEEKVLKLHNMARYLDELING